VPPGSLFAMGDNRDVSLDSRYWGFVPRENVIGRPMFIYWSFVTPRDEYERQGLGDRIQWMFNILFHFFDQTRWSRMFHVVR
jgi:signal peptidase I